MRCRRGLIFEHGCYMSALEHNFNKDVNIRHLCSSRVYKHNLYIWSRLGDLVRCILGFNFGAQELYI